MKNSISVPYSNSPATRRSCLPAQRLMSIFKSVVKEIRHLITCTLISSAVLFVLSSGARQVNAAPIRFEFTGVWRDVILIDGPVQPGDAFVGSFFYDPDAAVISFHGSGVSGEGTDYTFSPGGAGIEVHVSTASGIVTFRSDASAMSGEVLNNFSDGTAPPIDRFVLQSFASARFPSLYTRSFVRFDIDILDSDLTLVNSTVLPTNLTIPLNGYAFVGVQGGSTLADLDYDSAGTLQTLTPDSDGDGVPDTDDQCPNTPVRAIVDAHGCSIDQLVPCAGALSGGTWKNHGQYVSSVVNEAASFLAAGLISEEQQKAVIEAAARSNCGKK